jgi:2,4-dienoyl-CoA reductase (NADPH2)
MYVPRGAFVTLAHGIKSQVRVPVIGGIRINDSFLAEKILEEKKVDLVTMCRPLIADPELPLKAMEGRFGDIRMCVACNQKCLDNLSRRPPKAVGCLVNARAGQERMLAIQPTAIRKKVIVVGGGPGGMEAARVAAIRGHEVHLFEKNAKLGGQLNIAVLPPGKKELELIGRYYASQLKKVGVEVHLERSVTRQIVREQDPDAVVIATGASPSTPAIPGIRGSNVVMAEDVLMEKGKVGTDVVVIGGGPTGCETAHFLATKGIANRDAQAFSVRSETLTQIEAIEPPAMDRSIAIIEMLPRAATSMGANMRFPLMQELRRHGVKIITNARVEEINDNGVIYTAGGKTELLKADTVINACGYKPNRELYQDLYGEVSELYLIGDSKEPRSAAEAIEEGLVAALQI